MEERTKVLLDDLNEEEKAFKKEKRQEKREETKHNSNKAYSGDYNKQTHDFLCEMYPEDEYRFRYNPESFIAMAVLHGMDKTGNTIFALRDIKPEGLKKIIDEYLAYIKEREALLLAVRNEENTDYTLEQLKDEKNAYIKRLYNVFLRLHIPKFTFEEDVKLIIVAYTHLLYGAVKEFIGYYDDDIFKFNIEKLQFVEKTSYLALKYMIAENADDFVLDQDEKSWIYLVAPIIEGQTIAELNGYSDL